MPNLLLFRGVIPCLVKVLSSHNVNAHRVDITVASVACIHRGRNETDIRINKQDRLPVLDAKRADQTR